jgi:hypothetical protein
MSGSLSAFPLKHFVWDMSVGFNHNHRLRLSQTVDECTSLVTDEGGDALIANLSASDVRCLQPEHFGILGLPVAELLALLHGGGRFQLGFTCTDPETIQSICT